MVRNIGATVEWDLVRLGELQNQVGELYADFQGLGDSSWLNAQVGRFQIPLGENYLRFSKGYRDNPFISQHGRRTVVVGRGRPPLRAGRRAAASATSRRSRTARPPSTSTRTRDPQGTLKLYTDPWPWLHLSVSGLVSGEIGRTSEASEGALWLGETWAMPVGLFADVPNFIDGVAVRRRAERDRSHLVRGRRHGA